MNASSSCPLVSPPATTDFGATLGLPLPDRAGRPPGDSICILIRMLIILFAFIRFHRPEASRITSSRILCARQLRPGIHSPDTAMQGWTVLAMCQ